MGQASLKIIIRHDYILHQCISPNSQCSCCRDYLWHSMYLNNLNSKCRWCLKTLGVLGTLHNHSSSYNVVCLTCLPTDEKIIEVEYRV